MMNWTRRKTPPIRSLVGEGTTVRGDVHFADGLRVDGEVFGDLVCTSAGAGIVVVSEKAKVHGKVKCEHVIIAGEVVGPIEADGLVELQPSARVEGDIRYASLEIHAGARIDGELRPLKTADKPALKLAASNDH
jgi:cytoskeletal protein CcmA (bactofilin family)